MDKGRTKVKVTDEKRQKEVMSDRKEKNPRLNEGVTGGLRRRVRGSLTALILHSNSQHGDDNTEILCITKKIGLASISYLLVFILYLCVM